MSRNKFNTIDGFKSAGRKKDIQEKRRINTETNSAKVQKKIITKKPIIENRAKKGEKKSLNYYNSQRSAIKLENHAENRRINKSKRLATNNSLKLVDLPPVNKKKNNIFKKIIYWLILIFIVFSLIWVGTTINKVYKTSSNVFKGNIFGLFNKEPLKKDSNGRTNILVFGTSEDDKGHQGALLTDSIMVMSYKHKTKEISMISIPRDLWVNLDKPCDVGYKSRINAVYQCGSDYGKNENKGAEALQSKISEVTGLDIQYYAHVNFTVVEKLVDAVGGIEVVIESSDPRGIYDPAFDHWCNHKCNFVKYPNGPTGNLDGKHALALAMVRNCSAGYGLPNSNFDREKNQQKVIAAIVKKAVSSNNLLNTKKINSILDAIGDNLRTNIKTNEVQSGVEIARTLPKDFDFNQVKSISFMSDNKRIIKNDLISGQQVLVSVNGVNDYSPVHNYIKKELEPGLSNEKARISVLNGSSKVSLAARMSEKIEDKGILIDKIGNSEKKIKSKGIIYRKNYKKLTENYLKNNFGFKITKKIPKKYQKNKSDYIIIFGEKYEEDK